MLTPLYTLRSVARRPSSGRCRGEFTVRPIGYPRWNAATGGRVLRRIGRRAGAGPLPRSTKRRDTVIDTTRHNRDVARRQLMGHNEPPDTPDRGPRYQPEQNGMYELEFPAPQLSSSDGRGPVLVHALEGFSDAGHR